MKMVSPRSHSKGAINMNDSEVDDVNVLHAAFSHLHRTSCHDEILTN